jgi:WD40 repeat protein
MSFSQLDKTLNVRTKVRPLELAGLIALIASLEVSSLPGADESLRQANAGLIQTSSPGVIGAPLEHDAMIYSARFSPDGKRIVTASKDGTARVWDAATGDPVGEPMQSNEAVCAAEFSLDGKSVATACTWDARVWDAATGKAVSDRMKHDDEVVSARFSPDGRRVVTASWITARVWDVSSVLSPK